MFLGIGGLFGVLTIRALLLGVDIKGTDSWKLPCISALGSIPNKEETGQGLN